METILITGAAGHIGALLRESLARPGRTLRLMDRVAQDERDGVEVITAALEDTAALNAACRGATAVIHLGALSTRGYTWDEYERVNVTGTYHLLEAIRRSGVARFVFASSNHVVGFHPTTEGEVPDDLAPRPDSLYGASKAAGEALASLYHDRYGLDVLCLRIGSCRPVPDDERTRWSWLSPGDCTRLFEAALSVVNPGFRVVWGVSANSCGLVSLAAGRDIGYHPIDDAETHLETINDGPILSALERERVGGGFVSSALHPDEG